MGWVWIFSGTTCALCINWWGGGGGGARARHPGEMGVGIPQETGDDRTGSIVPEGVSGRNKKKAAMDNILHRGKNL